MGLFDKIKKNNGKSSKFEKEDLSHLTLAELVTKLDTYHTAFVNDFTNEAFIKFENAVNAFINLAATMPLQKRGIMQCYGNTLNGTVNAYRTCLTLGSEGHKKVQEIAPIQGTTISAIAMFDSMNR